MTPTEDRDALPMWVVYSNPSDYPGHFVVRRHLVVADQIYADITPTAVVLTLDEARAAIPPGAFNLGRYPEDDPCIVEVRV